MLGGVYSDQRCPKCNTVFQDLGERLEVCCPNHPDQKATRLIAKVGKTMKRFSGAYMYKRSHAWLGGIRAKIGDPDSHGTFDPRDYKVKDRPLSFSVLADEWTGELERAVATDELSKSTKDSYKNYMVKAKKFFKHANVKNITGRDIKTFLHSLDGIAGKTRHNYCMGLHKFWVWLLEDYDEHHPPIKRLPKFPTINYTLGRRNITNKKSQLAVLEKCKELFADQPRRWIGVQWLLRYTLLRPGDLNRITEGDVNYETGLVIVRKPTKAMKPDKTKGFYLLADDLELLRSLPRGMPNMPLFRHDKAIQSRIKPGMPFGPKMFYKTWVAGRDKVGLPGVDLYGGTRHTSVTDLQNYMTPDEIKAFGSQHETNKAFDRYFFPDAKKQIKVAELASGKGEIVELKQKAGNDESYT